MGSNDIYLPVWLPPSPPNYVWHPTSGADFLERLSGSGTEAKQAGEEKPNPKKSEKLWGRGQFNGTLEECAERIHAFFVPEDQTSHTGWSFHYLCEEGGEKRKKKKVGGPLTSPPYNETLWVSVMKSAFYTKTVVYTVVLRHFLCFVSNCEVWGHEVLLHMCLLK